MFTVFIKTELGEDSAGLVDPSSVASVEKNYKLGTGAVVGLAQGQDVTFADPKRPNQAFDPFVMSMLRQIGVSLGLPFEVLIKHFTASYSAARAALLEAWKFYRGRRTFLATNWCSLVFEAWMYEAVAMGRIEAPGFFTDPIFHRAYLKSEWVGDAPGQLDPQKEATAALIRVNGNLSDLKTETMELTGKNWEDVYRRRVRERKMLVDGGLVSSIPGAAETITNSTIPTTDGGTEEKPGGDQEKSENEQ
jgi:lambda family phage portal protein